MPAVHDIARVNERRRLNRDTPIDFTTGVRPEDVHNVPSGKGGAKSMYLEKLWQIVDAVEGGDATPGETYVIANYDTEHGAGDAIRALKRRDDLPDAEWLLVPERHEDGKSRLRAGIAADDVTATATTTSEVA